MTLTLNLSCDNAAFADNSGAEIARILRDMADKVDGMIRYDAKGTYSGDLRDINGNTVGKWECHQGPTALFGVFESGV